ncbi:MAG: rhodanese-like domain-containing protein [Bacteroidetes bacterium]|nr:rhodanese-like domain-containing protein [Bacteroidota bacterium]
MKTFKLIILLAAAMLIGAACSKQEQFKSADEMVARATKVVKLMTPQQLHDMMEAGEETYILIDVRQEKEHYYGYIPGSIVLPRGSLEFNIADPEFWENEGMYLPEKTDKIIVYCKKGQRGILAAETLGKLGYKNVYALEGGWKNWELTYPDLIEKDLDKLGGHSSAPASSGGC